MHCALSSDGSLFARGEGLRRFGKARPRPGVLGGEKGKLRRSIPAGMTRRGGMVKQPNPWNFIREKKTDVFFFVAVGNLMDHIKIHILPGTSL